MRFTCCFEAQHVSLVNIAHNAAGRDCVTTQRSRPALCSSGKTSW
jgi:hypothetical protein